ncbi:MAG: Hsp20/alpha crystallin family protein [Nitrososphaeraceae archaeon]
MATSQLSKRDRTVDHNELAVPRTFDQLFDNFRQDMENTFFSPLLGPFRDIRLPSSTSSVETKIPLCDVVDKGDKYTVTLEVPGIKKENIELKATNEYIAISALNEEKNEQKEEGYILRERFYKSFSRKIPFDEDIIASKIDATVENGILKIDLPKQKPKSVEETKIKIK